MKKVEQLRQTVQGPLLITHPTDLFYLTGLELSAGKLLVTPNSVHMIVDPRYLEEAKHKSPFPVLLLEENTLWDLLEDQRSLAIDSSQTSFSEAMRLSKECSDRGLKMIPIEGITKTLRAVKDAEEIRLLQESGHLGSLGFDFLLSRLKEGILAEELALELEIYWRKLGASGVSFKPIIAFGANASKPHYRSGKAALKKGDIVLLDIGVTLNHYHSDMTRVIFFKGGQPELKKVFGIVKKAHETALTMCRPGVAAKELDNAARSVIAENGYGEFFTHSLGHGIGLDVHETTFLRKTASDVLVEGMVITIEPGIYLPGVGGVRLEDTIVITKEGYENLTNRRMDWELDV